MCYWVCEFRIFCVWKSVCFNLIRSNFNGKLKSFILPEPNTIWKKVCTFGCQSCFLSLFLLEKQTFLFKRWFLSWYQIFNNYSYPDLHHSQGGMKFATQISPLPNFYFPTSFWEWKITKRRIWYFLWRKRRKIYTKFNQWNADVHLYYARYILSVPIFLKIK